ncbi:MAG TPA: hypothetical protein VEU30_01155, partial [Thermoanaerobaculia bacterium]|nr:hypothetical protein [Thermoanaerobaculia bacterium]
TRRKPFGGDSLTSISYKIVHEPFPPLHEINPQIPDGFEEVISNCLAKDPAKRYQRARDMGNALRSVMRGEKPVRPPDPMLADETIVTRDRDRQPTLEVPFPDAAEVADAPPADANVGGSTRPLAKATGAIAAASAGPRTPGQPIGQRVRTTLTNVRALPAWRRRIPPAAFIGTIAILVAGLIGAVVSIRAKAPAPAVVDTALEARRMREKQLREEGNALLRQGRVTDAYGKYEELRRLAPKSPFVTGIMEKLSAIRMQEEISKTQLAQAKAKFDEGVVQYNQKNYPAAIALFQESFTLNPNSLETADYLKAAQTEQQRADIARQQARTRSDTSKVATTTTTATATTPAGGDGPAAPVSTAPSQLNTVFNHPFTDGRIVVRAGADIVANEQLFIEQRRAFRRTVKVARPINVTNSVPAKNADVQVWVTVPAAGVQEHHTIPSVRLQPGQSHRLLVTYDPVTKKFAYDVN